jgi:hypothetical protein
MDLFKKYMMYYFFIDLVVIIVMILDAAYVELRFFKILIYFKVFLFQEIKEEIATAVKGNRWL